MTNPVENKLELAQRLLTAMSIDWITAYSPADGYVRFVDGNEGSKSLFVILHTNEVFQRVDGEEQMDMCYHADSFEMALTMVISLIYQRAALQQLSHWISEAQSLPSIMKKELGSMEGIEILTMDELHDWSRGHR